MKHAAVHSEGIETFADRYRREGFAFPFPVLTPEETGHFLAEVEELERRYGGRLTSLNAVQPHLFFPWAFELATHDRVLDVVESVLGPDILVHSTSVFCKYPHDPGYIPFHQDGHYWRLEKAMLVSAWIALTESSEANGALQVLPGSQTERLPHKYVPVEDHLLASGLTLDMPVRRSDVVTLALQPGSMSLHHVNLVHGSQPNRSDSKRLGIAVRYISPADKQQPLHHRAVLARGQDRYGHYELLAQKPSGNIDSALAEQNRFREWMLSHRSQYLKG